MVAGVGGDQAVTSSWEVEDAAEGTITPGTSEDFCWLDPNDRHPWQKATLGTQPGGG